MIQNYYLFLPMYNAWMVFLFFLAIIFSVISSVCNVMYAYIFNFLKKIYLKYI